MRWLPERSVCSKRKPAFGLLDVAGGKINKFPQSGLPFQRAARYRFPEGGICVVVTVLNQCGHIALHGGDFDLKSVSGDWIKALLQGQKAVFVLHRQADA